MGGALHLHRGAADQNKLDTGVKQNAKRLFKVHFFDRCCSPASRSACRAAAPLDSFFALSVGVSERFSISRVRSTPYFLAFASLLPRGGRAINCRARFL